MGTKKFDFFFQKSFIEFDLCWIAEINIQVGSNMHLYVDIRDASSSLWGSTSGSKLATIKLNSFMTILSSRVSWMQKSSDIVASYFITGNDKMSLSI